MRIDRFIICVVLVAGSLCSVALASDTGEGISPEEVADAYRRGIVSYNRGDVADAMGAFRIAAEAGHAGAQVRLGFIHDISGAMTEAEKWYRASAEQGDPDGKFYLARLLASDEVADPDPARALEIYRELSGSGYGQASVVLARTHERGGLGLPASAEHALQAWMTAAAQGEAEAALRLHEIYKNGELGVDPDTEEAARWIELSRVLGSAAEPAGTDEGIE